MKYGWLDLALCVLLCAGCGPDRPQTVHVNGRITFAGGTPPAADSIAFAPLEPAAGFPRRPASGSFDTSGTIHVTSFKENDGLVPGRYEVKVECWRKPPSELSEGESLLPEGFTVPDFDVPTRGPVTLSIDVPRP